MLTMENATPHEAEVLTRFLQGAVQKSWISGEVKVALAEVEVMLVVAGTGATNVVIAIVRRINKVLSPDEV